MLRKSTAPDGDREPCCLIHLRIVLVDGTAQQQPAERHPIERNQRIQIPFGGNGAGGDHADQHQHQSHDQTPPADPRDQQQKQQPEQLKRIPEFKIGLGKGGDGDKRHVQHHFRHPRRHRKLPQNQRTHHAERVAERGRCIERGEL